MYFWISIVLVNILIELKLENKYNLAEKFWISRNFTKQFKTMMNIISCIILNVYTNESNDWVS